MLILRIKFFNLQPCQPSFKYSDNVLEISPGGASESISVKERGVDSSSGFVSESLEVIWKADCILRSRRFFDHASMDHFGCTRTGIKLNP